MGLVWSRLQIIKKRPRALETPGSNPGDPTIFTLNWRERRKLNLNAPHINKLL